MWLCVVIGQDTKDANENFWYENFYVGKIIARRIVAVVLIHIQIFWSLKFENPT